MKGMDWLSSAQEIFGPYTWVEFVQRCLGEVLGTALLVYLGCMGVGLGQLSPSLQSFEHLIGTFNFGLAVMIPVLVVGHISNCHINPAVTLCLTILQHLKPAMAVVYVIFQCLGATLGYGVLYGLTPMFHGKTVCVTRLHKDLNVFQGMAHEAIGTGVLCLVVCGVVDKRNAHNTDAAAIKFGLTVASLALVESPYTGTSLNPARSLGPCIWTNDWKHHYVYWIGPLLGGAVVGLVYRFVFFIPKKKESNLETVASQDETKE